jgi:hypothetical protein
LTLSQIKALAEGRATPLNVLQLDSSQLDKKGRGQLPPTTGVVPQKGDRQ